MVKRFLVIGAHPDDPELMFGGCAVKLAKLGHKVKFVSCCNGDAGHYDATPLELAARRKREALKSAAIAGLAEYEILDNHDCEILPSLENRKRVIRLIRDFGPDVVISHRACDYHADHRATAQIVADSAFLVTVPMFCPDSPVPGENPIYMCSYDAFRKPALFSPDIAVKVDEVLEEKLRMLNCHESQFYEWLPYNRGVLDQVPATWEGRKTWLREGWLIRNLVQAKLASALLSERYRDGAEGQYAETFELSEYGRQSAPGELDALFPR
jgi:LmbE family N-acetylglucosaminyl deacetylase